MNLLPVIPLLPAAGALLNGLLGIRYFSKRTTALVACATMGAALALSVWAFVELLALPGAAREHTVRVATWIPPIPLETHSGLGSFAIDWTLRLDPLSAMMILVVTGIGFLIHVYATAYMHEEARGAYARFFCYLNLFCFFMLTLVLAANFLVMFVGWEGVGLCSYLLIGYWYERKSAADAGKKAFLVNRIGDFGFMLGMFLVFYIFGTLDFRTVANAAALMPIETAAFGTLSTICLLLFVGATGKSAQIPLYVWLPDAMEGPTPVSALIHAATMVTAGVYMVCRNAVLFTHAPIVMEIVAVIGVLTALMAATIGLVQTDIKRVLAYSTVSQLGYMFLATGVGAFAAGVFHLMTHAFFKALLFLGSGSVIHAMGGEQDMRRMGALRRFMPVTYATMMIGTLAIAGVPPFSGFFSKDEILFRTFLSNRALWGLAVVTAAMTAFYMFRLMSMTFFGNYRGPAWSGGDASSAGHEAAGTHAAHATDGSDGSSAHGVAPAAAATHGTHAAAPGAHGHWHGPHESPIAMTLPLQLLALGAVIAGFVGIPAALRGGNAIEHFLAPSFAAAPGQQGAARVESGPQSTHSADGHQGSGPADVAHAGAAAADPTHGAGGAPHDAESAAQGGHGSTAVELGLMVFSVLVALGGIAFAWRNYVVKPAAADSLAARLSGAHRLLWNKYYVDELYGATFVAAVMASARLSWRVDAIVVDGAVNGSGWFTRFSAWLSGVLDRTVVDGAVNAAGVTFREASHGFRRFQTGLVQNYALLMVVGVFVFLSVYLLAR